MLSFAPATISFFGTRYQKRPEHKHRCSPHGPPVIGATAQKEKPEDQIIALWLQKSRKEPEQMRRPEQKAEAASSSKLKSTQAQILSPVLYTILSAAAKLIALST